MGDVRVDKAALVRLLGAGPYSAPNASLADLLLAGWDRLGRSLFEQLEGEFAIVIEDLVDRRLVLARDALGQRPLFYRCAPASVVFGSRPIELARIDGEPRPDLIRLTRYLARLPEVGERSFIAGVNRVEPGHFVEFDAAGGQRVRRWWMPDLKAVRIGHDDALDWIGGEIKAAVGLAIAPDSVRVAAQLSGGLDSSIVVAVASPLLADSGRRLHAITADLSETAEIVDTTCFIDEGRIAAATAAEFCNVDHQIVSVGSPSPFASLERWLPWTDAPVHNACNLAWLDATYEAARAAGAERVLVGSSGNHGVSYPGRGRIAELTACLQWRQLAQEIPAIRDGGATVLGVLAMMIGPHLPPRIWHRLMGTSAEDRQDVFQASLLRAGDPRVLDARRHAIDIGFPIDGRPEKSASAHDRLQMLEWEDRGLGNISVEQRYGLSLEDPLGSRRVLEAILQLSSDHFFHQGVDRRLARSLLARRTTSPASSIRARGYQGGNWRPGFEGARSEMLQEVAAIEAHPDLHNLFDTRRMRTLIDQWPASGWHRIEQMVTYRSYLMPALGAARWARRLNDRPIEQAV